MVWKDTSTYSQRDEERVPYSFECNTKSLRIRIHRHIYHNPTDWLLTCSELRIENLVLPSKDLDKAKSEAVDIIKKTLRKLVEEIGGI